MWLHYIGVHRYTGLHKHRSLAATRETGEHRDVTIIRVLDRPRVSALIRLVSVLDERKCYETYARYVWNASG